MYIKLKYTLITLASFMLIALIVMGIVVNQLPDSKSIKQALKTNENTRTFGTSLTSEKEKSNTQQLHGTDNPAAEGETKVQDREEDKKKAKVAIKNFMNEDLSDIRVCENLGKSKTLDDVAKNKSTMENALGGIFDEQARQDPYLESFRWPLKAIFHDEQLSGLLNELMDSDTENLTEKDKESFFEKLGFYSKVARVTTHLLRRKSEFENLGDHAVHLSVLSRIANERPDLANSFELQSLCDEIEDSIKNNQLIDIKEERNKIKSLLNDLKIKPEKVGFAPDKYMKFNLKTSKEGLSFNLSTDEQSKK